VKTREEMADTILVDVIPEDEIRGVVCYQGDFIMKLPSKHVGVSIALMEVLAKVFTDDVSKKTVNEMITKLQVGNASIQ